MYELHVHVNSLQIYRNIQHCLKCVQHLHFYMHQQQADQPLRLYYNS